MYGDKYVWILPGYQVHRCVVFKTITITTTATYCSWNLNKFNFSEHSCSREEAMQILDRHFAVEFAKERRIREVKLPHDKVCYFAWYRIFSSHAVIERQPK